MQNVSVIIPAYNAETTITEALESVAAQTHPVLEIIVVDDMSSDSTSVIVAQWSKQSNIPLHLIRLPHNAGPAGSRNAGIEAASGTWIAFLDADDAWLPQRLQVQFQTADRHPNSVLLCGDTVPLEQDYSNVAPNADPPTQKLTMEDFVRRNPVATSTVLARREPIQRAGSFDPAFRGPEDYDLWLRLAAHHECLLLQTPLSRYRTTRGSLSMDDRTFLPQVLAVLNQAFSSGGALQQYRHLRSTALAEQYMSASWMAYNRGSRIMALRWLLHSWTCSCRKLQKEHHDPALRLKLLLRYMRPSLTDCHNPSLTNQSRC